jgi:hypothetical protein
VLVLRYRLGLQLHRSPKGLTVCPTKQIAPVVVRSISARDCSPTPTGVFKCFLFSSVSKGELTPPDEEPGLIKFRLLVKRRQFQKGGV